MNDAGIVRNRLTIEATIFNAKLLLDLQQSHTSTSHYLWGFIDNQPIQNHWASLNEYPATTPVSVAINKDMEKGGSLCRLDHLLRSYADHGHGQ